jgi:hypothetical protein
VVITGGDKIIAVVELSPFDEGSRMAENVQHT